MLNIFIKDHVCVLLSIRRYSELLYRRPLDLNKTYLCSKWIEHLIEMDSSGLENPEIILWAYSFGVCPISGVSIERSLPPPQVPFPGSRVDLEKKRQQRHRCHGERRGQRRLFLHSWANMQGWLMYWRTNILRKRTLYYVLLWWIVVE